MPRERQQSLAIFTGRAFGRIPPLGWLLAATSFAGLGVLTYLDGVGVHGPGASLMVLSCLVLSSVFRIWIGIHTFPHEGAAWIIASGLFGIVDVAIIALTGTMDIGVSPVFLIGLDMLMFGFAVACLGGASGRGE